MANLSRIKDFAKAKGISIDGLAEKVGMSQQGLRLLIKQNSTKVETLEKIASALGVPPSAFFDDSASIAQSVEGDITMPRSAWVVIQRQAESLASRDRQIDGLIEMLQDSLAEIKKMGAQKVAPVTSAAVG